MSSTTTQSKQAGNRLSTLSQKITSFFSVPLLIVLNLIILGGFITYIILNHQQEPSAVLAAVPHTSSVLETRKVPTLTPDPSRTPWSFTIPTATPTAIPTFVPSPTPTPTTAPTLPAEVNIEGIVGHRQSMPLSCESRSAVDWAAYFGKTIDENFFHNGLPVHDNPDKGFVGDVNGSWGQVPPKAYGVHGKPVAQRLREYGLKAKHVFDMSLDELKSEIAAGRPVMIWVVGHVGLGSPVKYTDSDGDISIVAKFEHTVIVIGYTENKITVLDGAKTYTRYNKEFLRSWGVLENQAIVWIE